MSNTMTVTELARLAGKSGKGECKNRSAQLRDYWNSPRSAAHRARLAKLAKTKPVRNRMPVSEKA